jgi:hypothetical protein
LADQKHAQVPNVLEGFTMTYRISRLFLIMPLPALIAQTLHVSSVAGVRGGKAAVEISLKSPVGKAPVGLQWETHVDAAQLVMDPDATATGDAAKESGKTVRCAAARANATSHICMVVGGQKPIPNGKLAVLLFRVQSSAKPGTAQVEIKNVVAVTAGLQSTKLAPAEGTITIRPK